MMKKEICQKILREHIQYSEQSCNLAGVGEEKYCTFFCPWEDLVFAMTTNLHSTWSVRPLFIDILKISLELLLFLEELRIETMTLSFDLWSNHSEMFK